MSFIFQIHSRVTKIQQHHYNLNISGVFFKILLGHLVSKVALNILHYNLELE